MGVRRRVMSTLVVAGALAISGCTGGGPGPEPSASTTVEPSVTASPTPSDPGVAKPERPADMDRTDEAGAAAAAEYFLSLYSYVMQTGDLAEWDAMSWETCGFCSGVRESALEIAASGDTYRGGEISVTDIRVLPIDEEIGGYPVDVAVLQEPSRRLSSSGAVVQESPGEGGSVRVDTLFTSDRWAILAVASAVS